MKEILRLTPGPKSGSRAQLSRTQGSSVRTFRTGDSGKKSSGRRARQRCKEGARFLTTHRPQGGGLPRRQTLHAGRVRLPLGRASVLSARAGKFVRQGPELAAKRRLSLWNDRCHCGEREFDIDSDADSAASADGVPFPSRSISMRRTTSSRC